MATFPDPIPSVPVPSYRLYDSGSVALAALFGSPLAAGHLMALNYKRLGMGNKAPGVFALGFAVTIAGGATYGAG